MADDGRVLLGWLSQREGDAHEVHTFAASLGDAARRINAAAIGIEQQRHHQPGIERRLAVGRAIAGIDLVKIQLLADQRHDKAREMIRIDEVLHAWWMKLRLIDLPGAKMLAHKTGINQTRANLNSDSSDRILCHALRTNLQ